MEVAVRGRAAQGRAGLTDATIVALSSGRPPAAIGVIRISGPSALAAATALAGALPTPRHAAVRAIRDQEGDLLDRALVIVFPGPASATGEDLIEFHCHGGRAVIEAVEAALRREPGVRLAEPGEFTRRALANGRIDLAEAEGLADLLEAETEIDRRAALAAAEGRVSRLVRGWMARVSDLSARIEASLDYAEEGDVAAEAASIAAVAADQALLVAEMDAVLAAPPVDRWRDGVRVVIAGPPNAGKSTLLNALAGRDAAIVSPIAGTTRDRVEVPVRRNGIGYVLIDTAGLHGSTADPIEIVGMARARDAVASADVVLWLDDAPARPPNALVVQAKADLPGREALRSGAAIAVSACDHPSIERLWEMIALRSRPPSGDGVMALSERAWSSCDNARKILLATKTDPILQGEQLRLARVPLSSVLGVDATEAMLDALFGRFCLGK